MHLNCQQLTIHLAKAFELVVARGFPCEVMNDEKEGLWHTEQVWAKCLKIDVEFARYTHCG
jgi:hypothetical protein